MKAIKLIDTPSSAYGVDVGGEIGNTGFHYWGKTPEGAEVVSLNPPETYGPGQFGGRRYYNARISPPIIEHWLRRIFTSLKRRWMP